MDKLRLDRRRFLGATGRSLAVVALAPGFVTLTWPDRSLAYSLMALDDAQAETLVQMTRRLFPHAALGDVYYAAAVASLDATAHDDPAKADLLAKGVAALDAQADGRWIDAAEARQIEILRSASATPFFRTVWAAANNALYNNSEVWEKFGYEGPSFEQGGYLTRGFNDLDWLPWPPESASPRS